jgi:aldose 1-epimerase
MSSPAPDLSIHWLEHAGQRLGLVPGLGGGVAAWQRVANSVANGVAIPPAPIDLWRPWNGLPDPGLLASYPLVPWSNRIGAGGFMQRGSFRAVARNRADQRYPLHGDGWLQPWTLTAGVSGSAEGVVGAAEASPPGATLTLQSRQFQGGPFDYDAEQTFLLFDGGLRQTLRVTQRGEGAMPFGLGLHPWFLRTPQVRLQAAVQGLWLRRDDLLPSAHSRDLPDGWDLRSGVPMDLGAGATDDTLIDNAFTGWSGQARVEWPEHRLAVELHMQPLGTPQGLVPPAYLLVYRPPFGPGFCVEPVSHAVDAFNLAGRPGLVELLPGQTLGLSVEWRILPMAP